MKNIRKQLQLAANMAEVVLQYRLEPHAGLEQHLKQLRKKLRRMISSQLYEEDIAEMLVSKQHFKIRNKVNRFMTETANEKQNQIWVQVQLSAIEKRSCQIFNQQLWEFGIVVGNDNKTKKPENSTQGIIQLLEHLLKHLHCIALLPLSRQHRNRLMVDHKVTIGVKESQMGLGKFQDLSMQEVVVLREEHEQPLVLRSKYFYNDRKVQQNIKEVILEKSFSTSGNSKKNSDASTDASRRVSIVQFYDSELDITVLSSSDDDELKQGVLLNPLRNEDEDQFQLLMEETKSDDERFLEDNSGLFQALNTLQSYL